MIGGSPATLVDGRPKLKTNRGLWISRSTDLGIFIDLEGEADSD